jgi:rsbT antagonist protein RsbS
VTIPILKLGRTLIASLQSAVMDQELTQLLDELARRVGDIEATGVVLDITAVDVVDSFTLRTLIDIAGVTRLRGAETVIVGMPPDVAFSMIKLGLRLDGVATALDLEGGLALLGDRSAPGDRSESERADAR